MNAYADRIRRVQQEMDNSNIEGMYLMMSGDSQYLTGVKRPPHNPTDDDKHGDELYGIYLTPDTNPVFVVPRMGASWYVCDEVKDKDWIEDVIVIDDGDDLPKVAESVLQKMENPRRVAISDRMWARFLFLIKSVDPDIEFLNASDIIAPMRAIKDETELKFMKEAGRITEKTFTSVLKRLRLGMSTYDIVREIEHQLNLSGGCGVPFHTGVSIRKNDGPENEDVPLQPGSVISFDFGVIYEGYSYDFGRTVFAGEPSDELKEYHDAVMDSQREAISAMKAGDITAAELNSLAREVIESRGWGDLFIHRLGHGIGIDVHEPPFLYELDDTTLQENMCFTVEPSIMTPEGIFIRVEDVVAVTSEGGRPLTDFSRDYLII